MSEYEIMDGPPPPAVLGRPKGTGPWQRFAEAVREADGRWVTKEAPSYSAACASRQRVLSRASPDEFDVVQRGTVVWAALRSGTHYRPSDQGQAS